MLHLCLYRMPSDTGLTVGHLHFGITQSSVHRELRFKCMDLYFYAEFITSHLCELDKYKLELRRLLCRVAEQEADLRKTRCEINISIDH